jgi:ataxin-3
MIATPRLQQAFIFNLSQHWFSIRRFGGQKWYNLNRCGAARPPLGMRLSADPPALLCSFNEQPQAVSDLYLGMTLNQAEAEGYSVFVVRPSEPSHTGSTSTAAEPTMLETSRADRMAEQLGATGLSAAPHASGSSSAANGASVDWTSYGNFDDEDAELQAALAASVASAGGSPAALTPPSRPISSLPSRPPSVRQASLEADDPVAASRARAQAQLERFQRDQAAALRGEDAGSFEIPSRSTRVGQSSRAANIGAGTSGASSRDDTASLSRRRRQGDPEPVVLDDSDDDAEDPASSLGLPVPPTRRSTVIRSPSAASPAPRRHDEDEEMMRRAVAESLREQEARDSLAASTSARTAMDMADNEEELPVEDDEDLDNDIQINYQDDYDLVSMAARPPSMPAYLESTDFSAFSAYDRNYDEEDAELQRAIKASMEGIPIDYTAPALALPPPQPSPFMRRASPPLPLPHVSNEPTPVAEPARADDDDADDDDNDDDAEAAPPALTPEEIRALRLARFG